MFTILVCDDEKDIVDAIEIYLAQEGYRVLKAYDGLQALEILKTEEVHLILLDVMMPKLDGIHTMMKIRETSSVPIIVLSAKSQDTDKVLGLNVGADDYVTKPFNPVELLARVRSQLRRYLQLGGGRPKASRIRIGGILLDTDAGRVLLDGEPVELTPREFDILSLLMRNAGTVFAPREIYRQLWNEEPLGAEKAVAVHIRHLREKLEINPAEPRWLKVVWGKGYKMEREIQ